MTLRSPRAVTAVSMVVAVCLLGMAIAIHHNPFGFADTAVMTWMLAHRTGELTADATVLTDLFSPAWVGVWTLIVAAIFALRDRAAQRALGVMATVATAGFVCEVMKLVVDRGRPPRIDQLASPEVAMSFPSGHVTGTAALVFGVAVIATSRSRRVTSVTALAAAAVIAVLAASTRLYLGAHWLSDVSAAIAVAGAAALTVPAMTTVVLAWLEPHTPQRWQHIVSSRVVTTTRG